MSNKKDTVKEFKQYAEGKLKNHVAELNTSYENEKLINRHYNKLIGNIGKYMIRN